jgi:hypothetical protein
MAKRLPPNPPKVTPLNRAASDWHRKGHCPYCPKGQMPNPQTATRHMSRAWAAAVSDLMREPR